jgi:GNAT superfamily N-acetyltransferase
MMAVEIKLLGPRDAGVFANSAPDVFDDPIDAGRAAEFLADPRHHLAVAVEDGRVVGFVSAVHYVHPDKPRPELWINEIGVAPTHRGRGLGTQYARNWSGRLGSMAAELPAIKPEGPFTQLVTVSPAAFPTRLSSILDHLRQRRQRQQHAADNLRAQEFLSGT